MTAPQITVRPLDDGDFQIVRGGEVYRRFQGQVHPGDVKAGERASAAEICEWQEFGAIVAEVA